MGFSWSYGEVRVFSGGAGIDPRRHTRTCRERDVPVEGADQADVEAAHVPQEWPRGNANRLVAQPNGGHSPGADRPVNGSGIAIEDLGDLSGREKEPRARDRTGDRVHATISLPLWRDASLDKRRAYASAAAPRGSRSPRSHLASVLWSTLIDVAMSD